MDVYFINLSIIEEESGDEWLNAKHCLMEDSTLSIRDEVIRKQTLNAEIQMVNNTLV